MSSVFKMTAEEQAQAVFEILSDVYEQSPWTLEQVKADLTQASTDYFYAYEEDGFVGFLALQQLVGEVEITNIAVKTSCQGRGYGRQLMAEIADIDMPIFLEVRASNQAAQALYQKNGFEVLGQRKNYYHAPVEDAVIMRRN